MTLETTVTKAKRSYVKPRAIPAAELSLVLQTKALCDWKLQTWSDDCGKTEALEANFKFKNFPAAIAFMSGLVDFCEELQHHPAWTNDHNRLRISLTTNSIGKKISAYDLTLAKEISNRFGAIAG